MPLMSNSLEPSFPEKILATRLAPGVARRLLHAIGFSLDVAIV
jgi:hypothetical protein